MNRNAIPFRQIAIGNVLIAMAWLGWGFTGIASLPRNLGLSETWWLYPILLGPSIIAAAMSLFGFHKYAAITFVLASLALGTGTWLFIAGPLWQLIHSLFFPDTRANYQRFVIWLMAGVMAIGFAKLIWNYRRDSKEIDDSPIDGP